MRGLYLILIMIVVACSKSNHEDVSSTESSAASCLSQWFEAQYSYLSGKSEFSKNMRTHQCAYGELVSLQNQMEEVISSQLLQQLWRGGKTELSLVEKALRVKSWLVGGHPQQLKKDELNNLLSIMERWGLFLEKTKFILPIMQKKKGEGELHDFEGAYINIKKHISDFVYYLPPLIEPFEMEIFSSLVSRGNEESKFAKDKNFYLALFLLTNLQEQEVDVRKTTKVVFQAIELIQNFKFQFESSWESLFKDFEKFYKWLEKPKAFFESLLDTNGSLPFLAFEKLSLYLSSEVYKGKYSGEMLHNSLKTFVSRVLSSPNSSAYTGVTKNHWSELSNLYKKWGWLERNQRKAYYYESILNLVSTTIIESYALPGNHYLLRNQFKRLFKDGIAWAKEADFFKEKVSVDLVFYDCDLFSRYGNGNLRLDWFELKQMIEKYLQRDRAPSFAEQNQIIAEELFYRFNHVDDVALLGRESRSLYNHFLTFIVTELKFEKGWRSRRAYFYWIKEKKWPQPEDDSYYYVRSGFAKPIMRESFVELIANTRANFVESASSH